MANNKPQQKKKIKNQDPMGNPVAMGRYGIKLIKDIAFGKIKGIESEYDKLTNEQFIQATISEIDSKIADGNIRYKALYTLYINEPYNARLNHLVKKELRLIEGWGLAKEIFTQIWYRHDPSIIYALINRLPEYRYFL